MPVEPLPARPAALSIGLIAATVALGLAVRFVPLGLPIPATKGGGSLLWAAMIYWIVSAARPRWTTGGAAMATITAATAVEIFKLHHGPQIDAFRLTLAGRLLLGRVFSAWDIAAYAVGTTMAAAADRAIRRGADQLPATRSAEQPCRVPGSL